jgi:hypothetical protein
MMVQTNKWTNFSWGLRFSYSSNTLLSVKNNILDFYDTGNTLNNNMYLSGMLCQTIAFLWVDHETPLE